MKDESSKINKNILNNERSLFDNQTFTNEKLLPQIHYIYIYIAYLVDNPSFIQVTLKTANIFRENA